MYAILNPQFALRSWTGRPCAVIQRDHVVPRRISMPDFLLLRQCDGSRDLPETDRLKKLINDGLCAPCARCVSFFRGARRGGFQKHGEGSGRFAGADGGAEGAE